MHKDDFCSLGSICDITDKVKLQAFLTSFQLLCSYQLLPQLVSVHKEHKSVPSIWRAAFIVIVDPSLTNQVYIPSFEDVEK